MGKNNKYMDWNEYQVLIDPFKFIKGLRGVKNE